MKYQLREEYQVPCVNGVRDAYRRKKVAPLLVAPCGSGKTVMFSYMAKTASDKGQLVLIMAHREGLCTQCGEKLMDNGVDFGYINPGFTPDYRKPVQVGTIQSIVSRMGRIWVYGNERLKAKGERQKAEIGFELPLQSKVLFVPDLIIIDEARRSLAPTYIKIINFYKKLNPKLLILGVDATPKRGDNKPLSLLFDEIVLGPSVRRLIDLGFLVEPKTFGTGVTIDLSEVDTTSDGEYNQIQLAEVVNKGCITGDAVDHYSRICPGVSTVVFCVSIKHAIDVAAEFRAAGYLFEHIDGTMKRSERNDIDRRLKSGELQGITSVDLVTDGYDAPVLQCAILLRPVLSLALAIQMPSRVLRPFPGKKFAYILDHVGLTAAHGFVDDDREWNLDGEVKAKGKRRKVKGEEAVKTTQCPQCYRMHKPALICDSCGFVYEVNSRIINTVEGELVELRSKAQEARTKLASGEIGQLAQMGGSDWAVNIQREWEGR